MPQLMMRSVFMDCQSGMHSHGSLVKSLTKIYQGTSLEKFWPDFLHHLKYSLIVFKREPAVERTLEFVARFATSLVTGDKKKEEEKGANQEQFLEEEEDTEEEMHPFLLNLFSFLLEHHGACDRAVRFRCCQVINKLLVSLGEDAQIDDVLYDKIYECMLQRLRDKFPAVRVQAVHALTRLQDPQDRDCPVINAYLFLLSCDTNADVRRSVLSAIAATTKTLPAILERTRDTKDLVRKLAYSVIAEKIHLRALTIAQRVSLLQEGLKDRVEVVRDACTNRLIQSWLRTQQGNILDLLKCLDVENSLETADLLLTALFKKSPITQLVDDFDLLNQELTIPIEDLGCESALYWRSLCNFVREMGTEAEVYLEKILPTGSTLAKYLKTIFEHMKVEENVEAQLRNEFILNQLLELTALLDFSDEVGRRQIDQIMRDLLLSDHVTHTLVKPILAILSLIHADVDNRVTTLVEIISDIREPITLVENKQNTEKQRQRDLKLAGIRVELNQLRESLEECVHNQDFSRAADLKAKVTELEESKVSLMDESTVPESQEIRVEKNDPLTLLKCLTIACEMLDDPSLQSLKATLQTLMEVLILPGVQNAEPAVRNAALRALGLCCLLNKDTAKAHLLLFMQVVQMDQESVKVTSLKIIFDLLHTFGLEAFEVNEVDENDSTEQPLFSDDEDQDEEEADDLLDVTKAGKGKKKAEEKQSTTAGSVLMILTTLLDSESSEIRTVSAEGLAKLMISGRVVSVKVMSRLLLLWYNPVTEDDAHLRHCLGAFFPIFAFAGRSNQQLLEDSFLPTLRTLFNAPATSPLAEVKVDNVAELLTQLTNSRHLVNQHNDLEDVKPHDSLAVKVCNEILADPNSFNVRTMCRVLTLLEISPDNLPSLKDLRVLSDRMLKEVKDKHCCKLMEKFQTHVSELCKHARRLAAPSGDGDLSMVEEEVEGADTQQETTQNPAVSDIGVGDVSQLPGDEDPEILPDGEGDTTGIRRLKTKRGNKSSCASILETPVTSSKKSRTTKAARAKEDRQPSDSDDIENDAFASPSPVRRSTRGKTQTKPAKSVAAATKQPKKKLQKQLLTDSDSQPSDTEAMEANNADKDEDSKSSTASTRSTRGTRQSKRNSRVKQVGNSGRRTPLSDIENEVK